MSWNPENWSRLRPHWIVRVIESRRRRAGKRMEASGGGLETNRNNVLRRILDSEDMPSLPQVAVKILQLTQSDESSM